MFFELGLDRVGFFRLCFYFLKSKLTRKTILQLL